MDSDCSSYALSWVTNDLLRANGGPVGTSQESELLESIAAARRCRSDLVQKMSTAAPKDLLELKTADHNATLYVARCTSLLAPIRRIPPEILSQVFVLHRDAVFTIDAVRGRDENSIRKEFGRTMNQLSAFTNTRNASAWEIFKITHVSVHWRNVALGAAELWSTFSFHCQWEDKDQQMYQVWLQRAGNHPLSFSFTCRHTHANRLPGIQYQYGCPDMLETLLMRSEYWQNVHLSLDKSYVERLNSIQKQIPLLQTLNLEITGGRPTTAAPLPAFSVAPKLHDVLLSTKQTVTITLPWAQLKCYEGEALVNRNPDTHVLKLAPRMSIFILDAGSFTYPTQTVGQNQLRHLHMKSVVGPADNLTLPSLQTLRFSVHSLTPRMLGPARFASIAGICSHAPALTELYIDQFRTTVPGANLGIVNILAATPGLASLTLVADTSIPADRVTDRIFDGITQLPLPLLPVLRELWITGLDMGGAFMDMVESRSTGSVETARLEKLILAELCVPEESDYLYRLDQLKAGGMNVSMHVVIREWTYSGESDVKVYNF
ncbi:hypothetical protein C8R43DRAFT_1043402 [Mycena crocata]|nr:hypothetical protein C8R43DRAFT_1043402 [Mycena crocata]